MDRSIRGSRFADVGGAHQEHLYKLLKRGKLKIYREGSKKLNIIKITFYESQNKNDGAQAENHSDGTYTIRINENFREEGSDRLFLLTHEIQHVIQGKDRGFRSFPRKDNALGGTASSYLFRQLKRGKLKIYREGSKKLNIIKITFYESQNKNEGGSIQNLSDGTYTIRVNKNFQEDYSIQQEDSIKRTLSHEIQHVIQGLERNVKAGRFTNAGKGRRQEQKNNE